MPRDNVHYGGWEHRDVHNINGATFVSHLSVDACNLFAKRSGLVAKSHVPCVARARKSQETTFRPVAKLFPRVATVRGDLVSRWQPWSILSNFEAFSSRTGDNLGTWGECLAWLRLGRLDADG